MNTQRMAKAGRKLCIVLILLHTNGKVADAVGIGVKTAGSVTRSSKHGGGSGQNRTVVTRLKRTALSRLSYAPMIVAERTRIELV